MIAVIDYGLGNLRSIAKALEEVGGNVLVTSDASQIQQADRVVLPGVGAFGDGMKNLRERNLIEILTQEVIQKKKPFLGICLGMQLIAKTSEEFGTYEGLGWIDAGVRRFAIDPHLKVPHVGWNAVRFIKEHPMLSGLPKEADFYFVHSYHLVSVNSDLVIGVCNYGGDFLACIAKDNMFATQFHPEKSQREGLNLLKNFLTWNP